MPVGILGSGWMGGKLGTLFARSGHEEVFSYARRREKLKPVCEGRLGEMGKPAVRFGSWSCKNANAFLESRISVSKS
jgi:hypothetical protein